MADQLGRWDFSSSPRVDRPTATPMSTSPSERPSRSAIAMSPSPGSTTATASTRFVSARTRRASGSFATHLQRSGTCRPGRPADGRPARDRACTDPSGSATSSTSPTPTARRTCPSARPATPGPTSPRAAGQTLKTLEEAPFNKIRMGVFPKDYISTPTSRFTTSSKADPTARTTWTVQPRVLPAFRNADRAPHGNGHRGRRHPFPPL